MGLKINVGGLTARGAPLHLPKGYQTATHISAGAYHICTVHQNGQLYTWGMGAAGRLGHDIGGEGGDCKADQSKPTLVVSLLGKPIVRTSCGYSHTMALTGTGKNGGGCYLGT